MSEVTKHLIRRDKLMLRSRKHLTAANLLAKGARAANRQALKLLRAAKEGK